MIDNAIYRGCVTAAKIGLLIPILLLIIITFIIVVVITIAHYMITYLQEG